MASNLTTYYIDTVARTPREAETPDADWTGGMNSGASNAPGVGINTGNYDPKASDWPRPTSDSVIEDSQILGGAASGLFAIDATFGDNAVVSFVQAVAPVAPDGLVETVDGFDIVNRTEQTIPKDSWVWGVGNNP